MPNTIANRAVINDWLCEKAKDDKDIVVLASDSRGSASLTPFFKAYPSQSIEVGIAEQDLVGIASGLSLVGKKPYLASPSCFLSMRAIEQIKIDVAYSHQNVKLIGISAGVSYGVLGTTHHAIQDIATTAAIQGLKIVVPSDWFETQKLMDLMYQDPSPYYIRVGRSAVEDVHENSDFNLEIGKAIALKKGDDATIIAIGEMVYPSLMAARSLEEKGIHVGVLAMPTIKPLDEDSIIQAAKKTKAIITVEDHSIIHGFGSMVAQVVGAHAPCWIETLGFPDTPLITGTNKQLFTYYGLDVAGIEARTLALVEKKYGRRLVGD